MSEADTQKLAESSETVGRSRSSLPRALFGDLLQFVEFICIILASVIVAYVYHSVRLQADFDFQNYAAAGIIGATGLTALLRRDGFYEFDRIQSSGGTIRAVASRWLIVVLGILAFGFALKVSENFSRVWLVAWTGASLVLLLSSRTIAATIVRRMIRDGGVFARRVAIVGATDTGLQFAKSIGASENGISIIGFFDDWTPGAEQPDDLKLTGGVDALEKAARQGLVDDIVIATMALENSTMRRLIRRLSALPVSVSICPNIHWLDHRGGAVTNLGSVNVLSLYRRPMEGWGSIMKGIEDYVLGWIILLTLSPLLLLIAAAVKLQDRGPVLFAQQRHGFNNSVFRIYKFRTMSVQEDGDEIKQAQLNDPRITPLGGFLRRYSLDELPQLLNVILGQMSLVGPRPHALAHNHQYAQMIENYSGRHKVKPGITGWAQVNGYRGETSENELMEERIRYDLAYIDNWSLWFDFKILAMTFVAVVFPKNAV